MFVLLRVQNFRRLVMIALKAISPVPNHRDVFNLYFNRDYGFGFKFEKMTGWVLVLVLYDKQTKTRTGTITEAERQSIGKVP